MKIKITDVLKAIKHKPEGSDYIEVEPAEEPSWQKQIEEWFRPRPPMNIDFRDYGTTAELVYRENGKEIKVRDMLIDFIRTEVIEKICEDFKHEWSTLNRETDIEIVKAKWIGGSNV